MLLPLALATNACKRSSSAEPPCAAVGAKFLALAKDALGGSPLAAQPDDTLRRAVLDQLPAMRDSIVTACTESRWSGAVRTCLVEANDHVAFEACEAQLDDEQRQALDRAARGEPAPGSSR